MQETRDIQSEHLKPLFAGTLNNVLYLHISPLKYQHISILDSWIFLFLCFQSIPVDMAG